MGVAKIGATAAVILLAAIPLNTCTEERHINRSIADPVHVHGTVRAWRCGIGDWVNNSPLEPDWLRFSVRTGEPASVTFIQDNGPRRTVETDESSDFDLHLSQGSYEIVVETGYSYPPDSIDNVHLDAGDTTIVLDIVYDVMDPLNILCAFNYDSGEDTLGIGLEWGIIQELNQRSYAGGNPVPVFNLGQVDPSGARTVYKSEFSPQIYVSYQLPINREYDGTRTWSVMGATEFLHAIIRNDDTHFFPDNFSLSPHGVYICMAQQ